MPSPPLKNRFDQGEWSGSVGDLGTLLPLAFALIVFNGFTPERLFFLWGIAYITTGYIFKIPVSVQPLKAMSVIAIAQGLSPEFLSSTAFFYGVFFILISATGILNSLQKWFSLPIVSGIQVGIGLILAHKALQLVFQKGWVLSQNVQNPLFNISVLVLAIFLLGFFRYKQQTLLILAVLGLAALAIKALSYSSIAGTEDVSLIHFRPPQLRFFLDATILLMIPQLPLTLGNAVFAASDTSHQLWNKQAVRVNPARLGLSIGVFNTLIGLFGGFPMCHGSGGMAAHAHFGGKTGGTTIIMGGILVLLSITPAASGIIFFIPVPILSTLLLFNSWRMITLQKKQILHPDMITIGLIAMTAFLTRNLTIALALGLTSEGLVRYYLSKSKPKHEGITHD